MTLPPCALALSGGVAKGAFHAGVLRSFAEFEIIPSAIVGASAGALNGAYTAKLIAEDRFTPYWVERIIGNLWLHQTSLQKLWASGDISDNSLRSLLGDTRLSVFMLRRMVDWMSPLRVREFLRFRFTSILSNKHFRQQLEQTLKTPRRVERAVHFAAAVTSLTGQVETYADQPLISYGGYISYHLKPEQTREEIDTLFADMRTVLRASSAFPGVFPPVPLKRSGKTDFYVDGGLTKNAPFGRAVKLDPEVRTIFLISCMPITQPTSGRIDNMLTIVDQVYKIIINKDLANDYRKIQQVNERIEKLQKMLQRDDAGMYIRNAYNHDLIDLSGFKSLEDFEKKRTVELVIIEPPVNLEGDPFAGFYRNDRLQLMERYIELGYETGKKVLTRYLEKHAAKSETQAEN